MISLAGEKINLILRLALLSFPILIILGPFALNCFSVIFSIYAITNYREFKFFDKTILIFFSTFIFLLFPFESIDFDNAFLKYLSFFRFILMLFGVIIFLKKENNKNNIFVKIYQVYVIILTIITIDVLVEYFSGYNLLGYSSEYVGRISSFTNDELIIGYIFSFLVLFTLIFIFQKTNHLIFFIFLCIFITISFLIGERSNFVKLTLLMMVFSFTYLFYLNKFRIKRLLAIISIFCILLIPFFQITKDTTQGKKLFDIIDRLIVYENNKITLNVKDEFFNTRHAPHYITAYKIFLDNPIFGIGINNFYLESSKIKYKIKSKCDEEDKEKHRCKYQASSNHPHQIYLEIISEVGLTGLLYFVFIFFFPVYISFKSLIKNKEINVLSHLLLHLFFIFPILPSGSFFGTNYGVPFWFNLSILLYLSNKNLKFYK